MGRWDEFIGDKEFDGHCESMLNTYSHAGGVTFAQYLRNSQFE